MQGTALGQRQWRAIVGIVVALIAAAAIVVGYLVVRDVQRPIPSFESLAEHPDSSLHGTVAYLDARTRCIRIVAAAGRPSKQVWCLPEMDVNDAVKLGKEIGPPQLVWLPAGRLEVTMFRMVPKGPGLRRGWQKIVDVRTGAVEDVPDADAPAAPNLDTRPTVSPSGARITTSSSAESGRIKIVLNDDDSGERTLLSAHGPGSYTYFLYDAFWSPDWKWVAADDSRILVITLDEPPVTRVLVTEAGGIGPVDDSRLATFAITAEDILTPGG